MSFWKKIKNIGVTENTAAEALRRIHLINQTSLMTTVFTFAFVPLMFFFEMKYYIPFQIAAGLLCSFCLFLSYKKAFNSAVLFLSLTLSANLCYCAICYHGTGVQYFFCPLAIVPFATVRNSTLIRFLIVWCIVSFFVTTWLSAILPVKGIIAEPFLTLTYCIVLFVVLATLLITTFNLKVANDKYEKNIIHQKKLVEEKQKEILDSIHYAKRIQRTLITNEKYIERKLKELKNKN
ncbi:MAG: hypothetical protein IAF38_15320 [Bacteroidia bacterium]|nr:hypothetical protein [Bacteroidia bacterium]